MTLDEVVERERALKVLHAAGCSCIPRFEQAPAELLPVGVASGLVVIHQGGCPFGDQMVDANRRGIIPKVAYTE